MKQKFKSHESERSKPLNYSKENSNLFKHELRKKIKGPKYQIINNMFIKNITIRRFKFFRVKTSVWRMNPINNINRAQRFLEDVKLINFKNMKYETIERASWVVDERSNQYFHWLTDCMQRIELIEDKLTEYPVLIPESFLKDNYVYDSLKLLDIPYIIIKKDTLYKVNKLIITSHVGRAGNYYKKIINRVANRFTKNLKGLKNVENINLSKRIWVSRELASKRKIKNFNEIEPVLKKYKFQIVNFENLSFKDQIYISHNAEIIAGLHGAGLSNMLFMKKNSLIIEVRDKNDNTNNCFFSLSSDLNLNYYFLSASACSENFYSSDYNLNADYLDKELNKCLSILNNS